MRLVRSVAELRIAVKTLREQGLRIGFVPTMGFLHEGHASLIRQCANRCDATVVSIFVNPTQFGPNEDLAKYPQDLEADQNLCLKLGVSLLFLPDAQEIYPSNFQTFIEPGRVAEPLCGKYRPGHFRGVATVVAKLFNMVQPDLAFFGQKDLQQTVVIKRMVRDLNLPVDIAVVPTLREADGLAMSSRNVYLSPDERRRALSISLALASAESAFKAGERDAAKLLSLAQECLWGVDELQYCELVDATSLEIMTGQVDRSAALCVAAFVGRTRLIDNLILSPDPFFDDLMARAADQVFVSTEKLVTTAELDLAANARFNPFERSVVTGVVETPFGAHPTGASPDYGIDLDHLKTYVGSAAPDAWADYRTRYVEVDPHAYLAAVGGAARVAALPAPVY